jgi:hypothetical protein
MITGTGVHDRPDSAFKINWTGCSRSNGIGVHDRPEHADEAAVVRAAYFAGAAAVIAVAALGGFLAAGL